MPSFETLSLPAIYGAAEQIKNVRRQSRLDDLREIATRQQIDQGNTQFNQGQEDRKTEIDARTAKQRYLEADAIERSDDPIAAVKQFSPEFIQHYEQTKGPGSFSQATPDEVKQMVAHAKPLFAAQAGIQMPARLQTIKGENGAILQQDPATGALRQIVAPQKVDHFAEGEKGKNERAAAAREAAKTKANAQFVTLTPDEITAAGLPPGTSAQRDVNTGKIDVLSKRDASSTLSQKDATTAKMKLNTVTLARQQLDNIRQRFEPLKGTMSAGAFGQGKVPSEAGRSFDAAVNQMRSTLTALTRVPGVGAMSDYETKLDQSKFPTRDEYESVTQQQIDDLDNMLNAIETGYKDLLVGGSAQGGATGTWSGGSQATAPNTAPSQSAATAQSAPVAVTSAAEAMKLPPGTVFITPDGRQKVRP